MPQITITNDQKAQLMGWINREKDHLLSIVAMSERVILPRVTGTLELAKNDLEFLTRLRNTMRSSDLTIQLSTEDIEIIAEVAGKNQWENRREFWLSIERLAGEALP